MMVMMTTMASGDDSDGDDDDVDDDDDDGDQDEDSGSEDIKEEDDGSSDDDDDDDDDNDGDDDEVKVREDEVKVKFEVKDEVDDMDVGDDVKVFAGASKVDDFDREEWDKKKKVESGRDVEEGRTIFLRSVDFAIDENES